MNYSLGSTESTALIQRSVPSSASCEETVYWRNHRGTVSTFTDTLGCRYAGQVVTYCLQFNISSCSSQIAMDTVRGTNLIHLCLYTIIFLTVFAGALNQELPVSVICYIIQWKSNCSSLVSVVLNQNGTPY